MVVKELWIKNNLASNQSKKKDDLGSNRFGKKKVFGSKSKKKYLAVNRLSKKKWFGSKPRKK